MKMGEVSASSADGGGLLFDPLWRDGGRCYVITLEKRPDRLSSFFEHMNHVEPWPLRPVSKFTAIDSEKCHPPAWWTHQPGAWGCYQSHVEILTHCLNEDVESVLIFEDDAVFRKGFATEAPRFLKNLPDDWEMVYLGGCLRRVRQHPPEYIDSNCIRAYSVLGTYAYAIRGKAFMRKLYRFLHTLTDEGPLHLDRQLSRLHMLREHKVYVPHRWLVDHAEGVSDVRNTDKHFEKFVFDDPITLVQQGVA